VKENFLLGLVAAGNKKQRGREAAIIELNLKETH